MLKMLDKEEGVAVVATAIPEKSTIFNFFNKSIPRMGPATAACKTHNVKSFPWNWTAFVMKPQEGIGKPFAPLRRLFV
jgi:hypothetical protein